MFENVNQVRKNTSTQFLFLLISHYLYYETDVIGKGNWSLFLSMSGGITIFFPANDNWR